MATRTTLAGQVIGSFEDIGKDVVKQTMKLPSDIVGSALESLGSSGTNKGQPGQQKNKQLVGLYDAREPHKEDEWDKIHQTKDTQVKQAIARSALEALTKRPREKEERVWDKNMKENEQKKLIKLHQEQAQSTLPLMSQKQTRGDLYGLKAKRSPGEIGKNVKTD